MKYILLFFLLLICDICSAGIASQHEIITVGDTPVGFSTSILFSDNTLAEAYCTVEGGNIRFFLDGTSPTASTGHLKYQDSSFSIEGMSNMQQFKAIRTGTDTTTIVVTFIRE